MKKLTATVVLIAGLAAAGRADTLNLSFFQNATDNLFQTRFAERDQLSNVAFSYDKAFRPFSFFSDGHYSYLYRNSAVSSYAQDLGLDALHSFNEKTAFYAAAKVGGAFYRSDYADFNFLRFGMVAALKSYLTPASILKLNYALDYKGFRTALFDHHSHLVNLSLDRYFASRTTVKAEAAWGYKYFLHPFLSSTASAEAAASGTSGGGMGHGGGRMGRRGGLFQTDGAGQGQGIQIASLSGLVAQGIGDRVGIRLSAVRQWTLSGENPFSEIEEFYLVENPSYDLYSWNGYGLSGLLTIEGPWRTQLKMGYTGSWKDFPGIEALDLEGTSVGVMRQDRRSQWEARLVKDFAAFSVVVGYAFIANHSNDRLFEWRGHFLTVGVEWNLNWGGAK
jgi:hypothetical protein